MTATARTHRTTQRRPPPRLTPPDPAQVLRAEIAQLGAQIDRRLGNPPGTAERGIYFWYYPPEDNTSLDLLAGLRADAVRFLATGRFAPEIDE